MLGAEGSQIPEDPRQTLSRSQESRAATSRRCNNPLAACPSARTVSFRSYQLDGQRMVFLINFGPLIRGGRPIYQKARGLSTAGSSRATEFNPVIKHRIMATLQGQAN